MNKLKLQNYSDGAIYKKRDGSYSVETSQGVGKGDSVASALADLSKGLKKHHEDANDTAVSKQSKESPKKVKN